MVLRVEGASTKLQSGHVAPQIPSCTCYVAPASGPRKSSLKTDKQSHGTAHSVPIFPNTTPVSFIFLKNTCRSDHFLITKFTIRPGTATTFTIVFPASKAAIFGSAAAAASSSTASVPVGTVIRARSLP